MDELTARRAGGAETNVCARGSGDDASAAPLVEAVGRVVTGGSRVSEQDLAFLDYHLPPEFIAQTPLADRSASKLLHLERSTGKIHHRTFKDVPDLLKAGDLLVMNETRVTALRLFGHKPTGGQVELLLLKELSEGRYEALVRPGRRLKEGYRVELEEGITATIQADLGEGRREVAFEPLPNLRATLEAISFAPLPPYIHNELKDRERYQTIYARAGGSAAAPTAGLHFTQQIMDALAAKGVEIAKVTLDVGLDTFRPIQGSPDGHQMHGERCSVSEQTADMIARCEGRIVAVGTTSVRTLESFAVGRRRVEVGERVSRLFIRPGFEFQVVDGAFTNFHMPRTSMLLLIAALAGGTSVAKSYEAALKKGYRFLSFGDSMLIL